MPVIGTFVSSKEGGWTGTIRTLLLAVKVRLVPNDNQASELAPAFLVFAGGCEIGAAWQKRSQGDDGRDYLSVRLDDPALGEPISAAMFHLSDREAQLVWKRQISPDRTQALERGALGQEP